MQNDRAQQLWRQNGLKESDGNEGGAGTASERSDAAWGRAHRAGVWGGTEGAVGIHGSWCPASEDDGKAGLGSRRDPSIHHDRTGLGQPRIFMVIFC